MKLRMAGICSLVLALALGVTAQLQIHGQSERQKLAFELIGGVAQSTLRGFQQNDARFNGIFESLRAADAINDTRAAIAASNHATFVSALSDLHDRVTALVDGGKVPAATLASVYRVSIGRTTGPNSITIFGYGSGMAIDKRHVLTAGHVADPLQGDIFRIDIFDINGVYVRSIDAKIVKSNNADLEPNKDLGLLEVAEDLPHFTPLDYGAVEVNDAIYCVGASYGYSPYHVFFGMLAAKASIPFTGLYDAAMCSMPGNSGGPVFNSKHQFIGVLVRGITGGLTAFVPVNTVKEFLNSKP